MGYINGQDRNQITLFPESIDEYITEENPVRVVDAFVSALNMEQMGFERAVPGEMGRPSYDPRDMLKLYIYGYINRIRTSRKLELEASRNLELMWLLERLKPDFKTIAEFRKVNKLAIQQVYRQFSLMCKDWDLFGKELVAVDGSKFRASNSKRNNFSKKKLTRHIRYIDEKITEYMEALDKGDAEESSTHVPNAEEIRKRIEQLQQRKELYEEYQQQLEESGEGEISTTDVDAKMMAVNNNGVDVCYNVQTVVDSKHNLVVDVDVITNPSDQGQLSEMSKKAKTLFEVDTLQALADKGYYSGEDLLACEEEHITTYVAKQVFANGTGERDFYSDRFTYLPEEDAYLCPAGQRLYYKKLRKTKTGKYREYRNRKACEACALREHCTKSQIGRAITRSVNQDFLDQVDKRTKANRKLYNKRQTMVEHPFGTVKRVFGFTHFLTRGLESVKTETSLAFLVYNLTRVMNILGTEEMRRRLATI